MNTYSTETRNGFEGVLAWLNKWACARTYGLGTKLPWDHTFMVESLSNSTIYVCYYVIAHLLHGDGEYICSSVTLTDSSFQRQETEASPVLWASLLIR